MRWFHLGVIVLFAAATIVFAAQNFQIVTVSFLRLNAQTPLALLIAIIYLLGAATGGSLLLLLRRSIEGAKRRKVGLSLITPGGFTSLARSTNCCMRWKVPVMLDVANYSAIELLGNGHRIEVRSLRPEDRDELVAAVDRTSAQSLYRRFFAAKRGFTEQEVAFFLNVDFVNHVALVAVRKEDEVSAIAGGGRYVVVQPGKAEVAFVVVDQYQGQGIGAALLRHLIVIASQASIKEFVAEVLPENVPMLKIFRKSGLRFSARREPDVVHVTLQLE